MKFSVTILGSNSSLPTLERNPSSQLVNHNEKYFLVDCAEGTQLQMKKYKINPQKINHIFISHLHGDHYFGLIGLISSMHLMGRVNPLKVFGPSGLEEIISLQFRYSGTYLAYPIEFITVNHLISETLYSDEHLDILSFPLKHRIPTTGYIFREKRMRPKLNKDIIGKLNPSIEEIRMIKRGMDYTNSKGITYLNHELTLEPPAPRKFVYCSDTAYDESIVPYIARADLLYHESTFLSSESQHAAEKQHSTAFEAATIASIANVKKLLLGHFSVRYDKPALFLQEALRKFKNTELASDGLSLEIG